MNVPIPSGERGYVSVYVALIASLVLVPLVMVGIDLITLAYYRAELRQTADALAIGAVAESYTVHVPIPTKFVEGIPVDGFVMNGLHLRNVTPAVGLWRWGGKSQLEPKLLDLMALNRDTVGPGLAVKTQQAQVLPMGSLFSPFMYVEVPLEADVKLQTPYLARLLSGRGTKGGNGVLTLSAKSCAAAWYKPDHWVHKWWTAKTVDLFVDWQEEPQNYYRLVNCVEKAADLDLISLAELVTAEQLALGENRKELDEWLSDRPTNPEVRRAKQKLEKGVPEECGPDDPCIEWSLASLRDWINATASRKKGSGSR